MSILGKKVSLYTKIGDNTGKPSTVKEVLQLIAEEKFIDRNTAYKKVLIQYQQFLEAHPEGLPKEVKDAWEEKVRKKKGTLPYVTWSGLFTYRELQKNPD